MVVVAILWLGRLQIVACEWWSYCFVLGHLRSDSVELLRERLMHDATLMQLST